MATTPEGKIKAAVKQWLNDKGAYWYMVVPTGYSRAGVPDFLVCLPDHTGHGRFIGIETKAPGKRNNTSPNQKRELQLITQAGGVSLVIDDVTQLDMHLGELFNDRQRRQAGVDP
ncbi:MAG: VRR-NUC domain-containing protein [Chloroflexia bacterium]|nr:VRR-NUC domain-containing protein [Chloroflexia bacterium]